MIYRVSFYRKAEVVADRAPRYMVDVDADTMDDATAMIEAEPGVVVRSAYKTPPNRTLAEIIQNTESRLEWAKSMKNETKMADCGQPYTGVSKPHSKDDDLCKACLKKYTDVQKVRLERLRSGKARPSEKGPIRKQPSYVFLTVEARKKWYSSHKSKQTVRLCHECGKNPVEHYKRLCPNCLSKRVVEVTEKPCIGCKINLPTSTRKRYCDDCATTRKVTQEKSHRQKRSKLNTVERIKEQVAWAEEQLKTVTLSYCKLSSRFQGLRLPHVDVFVPDEEESESGTWEAPPNRCRACLQKFIDVQTVYLSNILTEEVPEVNLFTENENVHSLSASAGQ